MTLCIILREVRSADMVLPLSLGPSKWGPTLVVNVVALCLASYLALVYQAAMTRRVLAE